MDTPKKVLIRGVFAFLLLSSVSLVAIDYATAEEKTQRLAVREAYTTGSNEQLVPPRENATVIISDRVFGGQRKSAIVAYAADGSPLYYNETYDNYQDVDPVSEGQWTVEYLAAERPPASECHSNTDCSRMVIERVNLSTGNVTRLYSRLVFDRSHGAIKRGDMEWHDADRISEHDYLVGDIALDRVFLVNVTSGMVEWEWNALSDYSTSGGGEHPADWTHLNDIEYLPDGRIMVSLRNQDQVVFINRTTGLESKWILGADEQHSILYGQHNPDYLQGSGHGSVLVSDSENNRILEFQRTKGEWKRTWIYSTSGTNWPRDADRLPNGHTLITSSGNGRVFEVNEEGEVVWEVSVSLPYEAERLGTGPESQNGPTAGEADLKNVSKGIGPRRGSESTATSSGLLAKIENTWSYIMHSILFVLPPRFDSFGVYASLLALLTGMAWGIVEFRWSALQLQRPLTTKKSK